MGGRGYIVRLNLNLIVAPDDPLMLRAWNMNKDRKIYTKLNYAPSPQQLPASNLLLGAVLFVLDFKMCCNTKYNEI